MTGKRSQNRKAVGSPLSDDISDNSSKEQEYFLPIANVSRIMKKSLPANAKISKEAKETVQECVSEFISFITGEASEKCQMEKRKTINGDDLLWAMSTLGFENYIEPLRDYLSKYRETEGEKNSMAMKEDHSAATSSSNNISLGEISQVTSFISSRPDLQNLNNGDHHLIGARMAAKGKGVHEKVIGYDDNIMTDHGFSIGKIHEIDENAYRAMASNLHQW